MIEGSIPVSKRLCGGIVRAVRAAGMPAIGDAVHPSRREALGVLGTLGVLPALGPVTGHAAAAGAGGGGDAGGCPGLVTEWDRKEFARLKALNLDASEVAARRNAMPTGKIGDLTIGRLISGSNLISMNVHARDLGYVRDLAASYNTEARIFMTLKRCEEHGINTINLKSPRINCLAARGAPFRR